MKILIPEFMLPEPVARLRAAHRVVHDDTLIDRPEDLFREARDADAIIVRNRSQVRGALLDALQQCKVVGRLGVGLDNIDLVTCKERGIEVVPAIGANARSVAEYVVTTAMMLLRGAYCSSAEQAAGKWPRIAATRGREVCGRTIGIVGFGSIGEITGRLAHALGMHVVAFERNPSGRKLDYEYRSLSLDELLATSDVVSLHMPLTPESRGLFGAQRIAQMKRGSVLINTARGGVVDERALAEALHAGRIAGAALDVFEQEPLPAGTVLANVPNLILTPHIAGVTTDSEARVCDMIAGKVLELLAQ